MRSTIAYGFFFAFLLIGSTSFAQVTFNPKVGANVSGLDTKLRDFQTEARVGWNAGFDLRLGEGFFYLQPGIHYNNYSARLFEDLKVDDEIRLEDETTIQSLKMPLNVGLRLTGNSRLLGIHAFGGITPTYLLGVKEQASFPLDKEDLNDWTFGANFGAGIDILFFTIDANYEIGLNDYFVDAGGRNNVFTVSLGLKF